MTNVLVTGGAGYIGSHACKALAKAGSLTILEAMRDHGIRNIVFSSTCAVYGNPETVPIPEDHPTKPKELKKFWAGIRSMRALMISFRQPGTGTKDLS